MSRRLDDPAAAMKRSRSGPPTVLTDAVARFQAEVRRLAAAAVHAVVEAELDRKRTAVTAERRTNQQRARPPEPAATRSRAARAPRPPKQAAVRPARPRADRPAKPPVEQLELPLTGVSVRAEGGEAGATLKPTPVEVPAAALVTTASPSSTAVEPAMAAVPAAPVAAAAVASLQPAPPAASGKQGEWTRDAILDELAKWLMSGTKADAWFLKRYGSPGLFPAAVRIFGRVEAALVLARLHAAKLYPDGPPAGSASQQRRAAHASVPRAR
jgi:hypothetical protein